MLRAYSKALGGGPSTQTLKVHGHDHRPGVQGQFSHGLQNEFSLMRVERRCRGRRQHVVAEGCRSLNVQDCQGGVPGDSEEPRAAASRCHFLWFHLVVEVAVDGAEADGLGLLQGIQHGVLGEPPFQVDLTFGSHARRHLCSSSFVGNRGERRRADRDCAAGRAARAASSPGYRQGGPSWRASTVGAFFRPSPGNGSAWVSSFVL